MTQKKMPHLGSLMDQKIYETHNTRNSIGKLIGKSHLTVFGYTKEASLQCRILWDLSQALNFDFFEHLSKCLDLNGKFEDENINTEKNISKDTAIANLQQEISDLQKELAIYKEIVFKKLG